MQRRDALALLAWGAVAGCARRDPASVEATTGSAVGERFAVDGPEGVAVTVTATDARGEPFAVRLRPGADGHVDPAHRVGANATAVRRRAGSATVRSRGLAGDPVRMLFHRMTPAASPTPPTFVAWTGDEPTGRVAVTASTVDGSTSATVDRTVVDPAVTTRRIAVGDLTGLAVDPPGEGPHPGVLMFHGSAGTVPGAYARALATHGYAVLAPRYFGAPGLPESLDDVPLEYFDRAVAHLAGRDDVRDGALGFAGLSRGVEAALLTAAAYDGRAAVVGYSGSGLVAPGIGTDGRQRGAEAAWTRDGDPVASATAMRSVWTALRSARVACDATDCVLERLRSADGVDAVAVPVEAVAGPVALFTGGRDALWAAGPRSAYAVDRLARHDYPHPYCHVVYPAAGHVFATPYGDYSGATGPRLGGSPAANAAAAADAWVRTLDYLAAGRRE